MNYAQQSMAANMLVMANVSLKLKGNVAGQFYVDETCIDCDLCRSVAPEIFQRDAEITGLTLVYHQPATVTERALAEEALENCPCDSIGRDGDKT